MILLAIVVAITAIHESSYLTRGYRGLVPMHSTRRDVERVLGPSTAPDRRTYETADARVVFEYSVGACEKGWPYGWNVPQDTVVSIRLFPATSVYLETLALDQKKYSRLVDTHISNRIYYSNDYDGVTIVADDRGHVMNFAYHAKASEQKLQCPAARNRLPRGRDQADSLFKFDEYSDPPLDLERERLDLLAAQLLRLPETDAYIFVYAGAEAHGGEAKARAACIRNYLIRKHRLNANRIHAIDGGYCTGRLVEFYVEQRNGPLPLARPDLRPSQVKLSSSKPAKCNL